MNLLDTLKQAKEVIEDVFGKGKVDIPVLNNLTSAIAELEKAEQLKSNLQPLVDSCNNNKYHRDIKTAVDRFLCWKLPKDFYPDAGIYFKLYGDYGYDDSRWPIGTNLFTASQAKEMFEHCLEGTGYILHPSDDEKLREDAERYRLLRNRTCPIYVVTEEVANTPAYYGDFLDYIVDAARKHKKKK